MNINFSELHDVECEECGSTHFQQVFLLKKVPAVLSPTSQPTLAPAPVFRCVECGHINEELMPK